MAIFVKLSSDTGDVYVNPANVTKIEEVKGANYCYVRFNCADQLVRANGAARAVAELIGAVNQPAETRVLRFGGTDRQSS